MAAITPSHRESIFNAVKSMYTDVASCPDKTFHFPTGRTACEFLVYPAEQLDALPATAGGCRSAMSSSARMRIRSRRPGR